jgi:hypothetical protein
MKYEIKELKTIPVLDKLIPCHIVGIESTKKKAIEKLENRIKGFLSGRPFKFDENRKYVCYVYEVKSGYEAILISLHKNMKSGLFEEPGAED